MTDDPDEMPPALARLLQGITEALRDAQRHDQRHHESQEQAQAAIEFARNRPEGAAVPLGLHMDEIPEHLRDLTHGLLIEQGRASLLLGQLDPAHPYRVMLHALKDAWEEAAAIGALQIAKHNVEHHGERLQLGPEEYGAAWGSIAVSALVGAVRYGQEHPDAFRGTEGLAPGAIDETVAQLIEWAASEHGKGGEAAPEDEA